MITISFRWLVVVALVVEVMATTGCKSKQPPVVTHDTPISGTIHISADESFKPIIDQQVYVYENSFPGTHIIVHYKSEAACIRDLLHDTATHMVIITRGPSESEDQFLEDSLSYVPRRDRLANDAVAVVVNINSPDTLFTKQSLQELLSGGASVKRNVVFDGVNATSIVRYAMDSILMGKRFDTSVVKAQQNSQAVLNYVANNLDAIGLVGFSWIGNPEDTAQTNLLKKVKIAYVRCDACEDSAYVKPSQLGLLTKRYPLIRGLYYVLRENYAGLGSGFASFLEYERGQLIFRRAYLAPLKMGFAIRDVKINQKLKKD